MMYATLINFINSFTFFLIKVVIRIDNFNLKKIGHRIDNMSIFYFK